MPHRNVVLAPPRGPYVVGAHGMRATNTANVTLTVVVPTYNEADNIVALCKGISEVFRDLPDAVEIIVVDDDSPDRTWEKASRYAQSNPAVMVMRRRGERGLSSAVIRGWQAARGDLLGVIDADGQHPVGVLRQLYSCMHTEDRTPHYDVAIASRYVAGGGVVNWTWGRRCISRGSAFVSRAILPDILSAIHDPLSGCFVVRRSALHGYPLAPTGFKILLEILGRTAIRTPVEVGYHFLPRVAGESKATFSQGLACIQQLLALRLHRWSLGARRGTTRA